MKTPKRKNKPSNLIEYISWKVKITGDEKSETVRNAIRQEQRIKWAWVIIALLSVLLYHTTAPLMIAAIYKVPSFLSQIKLWFSG